MATKKRTKNATTNVHTTNEGTISNIASWKGRKRAQADSDAVSQNYSRDSYSGGTRGKKTSLGEGRISAN